MTADTLDFFGPSGYSTISIIPIEDYFGPSGQWATVSTNQDVPTAGPFEAGYSLRKVVHTEESDRLYRATGSGFQIAEAIVVCPSPDRALVITGIETGQEFAQGECCPVTLYDGDEVIFRWPQAFCGGVVPMEFAHGIRCGCGNNARVTMICDGANCYASLKCRLE